MTPLLWTVLAGGAVSLAGVCLGLQQILSAPDRPNYPTAGPWTRLVMFWLSGLMIARGVEIVTKATAAEAYTLGGLAVTVSCLICLHFSLQLYSHLTQRASVRARAIINRLHAMARCAPKEGVVAARKSAGGSDQPASVVPEALLTLTMDGVRVAAPNEGPEAFTGPWQ